MSHRDQIHQVGKLVAEENVAHAKPRKGGRDQPTQYDRELVRVQLWQLDPEGPHGPMVELRIVHPKEDEVDEVLRFADMTTAEKHAEAYINSLRGSLAAHGLEDLKPEEE